MKARFYFADGRVVEEVNLDPRTIHHAMIDAGRMRWFAMTGDTDQDGFVVLRERHDNPTQGTTRPRSS